MKVTLRVVLRKTMFPSGPGYALYAGPVQIGSIGKHYREIRWWWQVDKKLVMALGSSPRAIPRAGMSATKPGALAALVRAVKRQPAPRA